VSKGAKARDHKSMPGIIKRQAHRRALTGVLSWVRMSSSDRFCPWETPAPGGTPVLAAWCEHPGRQCVRYVRGKKRRSSGLPVSCLCL
jgi:hypothetical protein